MGKTILITGATDGIGLETAKLLAAGGNDLILHGRSHAKLAKAEQIVSACDSRVRIATYTCDLSHLADVSVFADAVAENHDHVDVLINNAGVYKAPNPITPDGLDIRFAVNTFAPYLLTRQLLPRLGTGTRVINLSSAAQEPVNLDALSGAARLSDGSAYAQSKLAITMWSKAMAADLGPDGPVIIAVNPGSLLGSKMVQEAFGVPGSDIGIGAKILVRAALSEEFGDASGKYFDNDSGVFGWPHPDALDDRKLLAVCDAIEGVMDKFLAGRA